MDCYPSPLPPLQYLLKMWIIQGKSDDMYRAMWEQVRSCLSLFVLLLPHTCELS